MSIPPPSPLSYEGQISVPYIIRNFDPTSSNNSFAVPTIWINPSDGTAFMLTAKALGVAVWLPLGGGDAPAINVTQIDTPDGNHVEPVDGVISFLNGDGMDITGSGNEITFTSLGGGITWNLINDDTSVDLEPGNGYVPNNSFIVDFFLPLTSEFGDLYVISGLGEGGWTVQQNANQRIIVGLNTTTTGLAGDVESTSQYDTIELLCVEPNLTWKAIDWTGNVHVT